MKYLVIGTLLVTGFSTAAIGQDQDALKACVSISKDKKRLACYDQIMMKTLAEENPEIIEKKEEKKKADFGLRKPDEPVARKDFGLPEPKIEKPKNSNLIAVSVTKIKREQNRKYTFTTAEGQVWRQTDSLARPLSRKGFEATIKKSAAGSYILEPVSGKWSMRVKRLR